MADLTISLVQPDLRWEDITANLAHLEVLIREIREYTEVILLPEMFSTGFSMEPAKSAQEMDGTAVTWMSRLASELGVILCGSLMIRLGEEYRNRLIWMQPDGRYGYYDKRHLFSYGGEDRSYSPGNHRLIASVKGWKVCLNICYDLRFPVWTRQNPADQQGTYYDLLVFLANWPRQRELAWNTLLRARAIENLAYVAGVNRVGEDGLHQVYDGDSTLIGPLGEICYRKSGVEEVRTIRLSREHLEETRNKYPFLQDADNFFLNGGATK